MINSSGGETPRFHIVLVEPEIPQNTGNIARTCAATGSALHLVKPFGFEITDRHLKRAGLDYWDKLEIFYYENLTEFLEKNADRQLFFSRPKRRAAIPRCGIRLRVCWCSARRLRDFPNGSCGSIRTPACAFPCWGTSAR